MLSHFSTLGFTILLAFAVHSSVFADFPEAKRNRLIDSLETAYTEAQHDTTRAKSLLGIVVVSYRSNPDTALFVCNQALELSQREGLAVYALISYAWLGSIYTRKGEIKKALSSYNAAIDFYEKVIDKKTMDGVTLLNASEILVFKKNMNTMLNNAGIVYKDQGNIEKALECYTMSLQNFEEAGDMFSVGGCLNNIGGIYSEQGETEKALEYYFKSLEIRREVKDKNGEAYTLNNLGAVYQYLEENTKALDYYTMSVEIYQEIENKQGEAMALNNIGGMYKIQKEIEMGLESFLKSLKIYEDLGLKDGMSGAMNNIGFIYLEKGEYAMAKEYAERSMALATDLGFPLYIKGAAKLYSKVYMEEHDFKQALEMYELHIQMRDSIKNEQTQKATIRQQTKYEFEKAQLVKEQEEHEAGRVEAEILSRRDNLQYSVVLICLLVIGVLVAMLGRLSLSERTAEGIIFFSFLILFEFFLVLADPYIEGWSGGAPGIKLLFNAGIAALIFPAHAFFESTLKRRLAK